MRKFNVNVNGQNYAVTVEEVVGAQAQAPVAAPAPVQAPAPVAPSAPAGGGETIVCPMPGTILSVNVAVGATVNAGDVIFILEAMKMENEIMAPVGGKVNSINVAKGSSVNAGDVLAVIG